MLLSYNFRFIIFSLIILTNITAIAQTNIHTLELQRVEETLMTHYINSKNCAETYSCDPNEHSTKFMNTLYQALLNKPETFEYSFHELQNEYALEIVQSPDNRLKVYSTPKLPYTSMVEHYTILCYNNNGKIILGDNNLNAMVEKIDHIYHWIINNDDYYFLIKNSTISSNDIAQTIECVKIENGKIKRDVKIFKSKDKKIASISINFLRNTVSENRDPYNLILVKEQEREIWIPVVNKNMELQSNHLIYKLKGNHLNYIGVQ